MGLWSAFKSAASGNFRDAGNYLFTDEDDIETHESVKNAQEARIAQQYQTGLIDEQEAGELMNLSAQTAFPYLWRNEEGGDPVKVFADTVKVNTGKVWDSALGATTKLVPWWIWALLIVGAIIYFWPLVRTAISFRSSLK